MTAGEKEAKTSWAMQIVPVGAPITEIEVLLGGNVSPSIVVGVRGENGVVNFDIAAGGHPEWTNPVRILEDLREIAELGILAYTEEEESNG